jgi:two-component system, OmpR family, sensor kinase
MVSKNSLSGRLTRTLILWFSAVWLVSVMVVGWYMHREVNLDLDGEMIDSGRRMLDIAGHEYEENVEHGKPLPPTPIVVPPLPDNIPVIFQLVTSEHKVFVKSQHAPEKAFDVALKAGFQDTALWRVYTVEHPYLPTFLHLAALHSERNTVLQSTILGLTLPMIAVLPLLAWLLSTVARRELRSVQQLEAEIAERGGANLRPVPLTGMPTELRSVGEHVNHLLGRLTEALNVERALAAHAAHELRTPLATACLRLETALATDVKREDVQASLDALKVLRHRTERLLQLSQAESGSVENLKNICLVKLAATVAQEFWDNALATVQLDLIVPPVDLPSVVADADGLAIALRNLVDNALRHGNGSRVEIEVISPSSVAVRDFGPGLSAERLQILLQRHVRQVSSQAGFGLGLSIVKTVVAKQQAKLELHSPVQGSDTGFEARIVLRSAVEAVEPTKQRAQSAAGSSAWEHTPAQFT